jgi:hypothetical protein
MVQLVVEEEEEEEEEGGRLNWKETIIVITRDFT